MSERCQDPLTEVLRDFRVEESFYCECELRGAWGIGIPERKMASYHFVIEGEFSLRLGAEVLRLRAGEMVLLPRGEPHEVLSGEGQASIPFPSMPGVEVVSKRVARLRCGDGGSRSVLLCGGVRLEPSEHPMLSSLPSRILLRGRAGALMGYLRQEVSAPRAASEAVVARLTEVLVLEAMRGWLEESPEARQGWLAALRDPKIGKVLALIHQRSEASWTVHGLAEQAGMSRTVFCERFVSLVGVPPLQYLTGVRMRAASQWLREQRVPVREVAARFGYSSEAAFSRAFRRQFGRPPGAVRGGR